MTENHELEKKLWTAADKLRNNMDAAEYKHVVLGLIFLKYISDSFDELYQKLEKEKKKTGADPEDKDEYTAERVFYVPPSARWKWLQGRAKLPTIGKDIDDAMDAIEKDNQTLKGVLPKDYARPALDKHRLGELIDLIGSITLSKNGNGKGKDVLGFVFEYFLGQFADAEGKKGGQFYTPQSIVKLLVEVLAPEPEKRVYDGCCGSGGMFVQSERFIELHEHRKGKISVYGQESNPTTYKLAKMNLAIRGIDAKIELGDTLMNDKFPELKVDYILANPPFNVSDYNINKAETHKWKYGVPPTGNANYAWLQHFISKLAPYGTAGIVLANGSMSSDTGTEGQIRKELIENDLVDCMIALPSQLFYNTQIPACLWLLSRNKTNSKFRNRSNEILFIDAREIGSMISRKQKELTDTDILKIADAYHNWRSKEWKKKYKDTPGFCKAASIEKIRKNNYVLTPGRYIDFKEVAGRVFNQDIGILFKWLDKVKFQKCVHSVTIREIEKNPNTITVETFRIKLESYEQLLTTAAMVDEVSKVSAKYDSNENDRNDTILLNEVFVGRVDLLISEDKKIHTKAEALGISDRVYTINTFLEKIYAEYPELVNYKVLGVQQKLFGELDLSDPFFDTLKEDYPGFDKWFHKKANDKAYVTINDENKKLLSFLFLKTEDKTETYPDIAPAFGSKKRLKVGTFKVVSNGVRLGERFMKIIFDNAIAQKVEEIYVTIFEKREEQKRLISLMEDWGFQRYGIKGENGELVYVRNFSPTFNVANPKLTYPFIGLNNNVFLVPIYPEYHTELLPDSYLKTESPQNYIEHEPHRNALSKVYICRSIERGLQRGDIIIFYRTAENGKSGYHSSVITTLAIAEGKIDGIADENEFIAKCRKRSVFSNEELKKFWNYKPTYRPFIINFLYVYSFQLGKRLNRKTLLDLGVLSGQENELRGLKKITKEQFQTILTHTATNESIIVH